MTAPLARDRALSALKRFAERAPVPASVCELCSLPLPPRHSHVLEPLGRALSCACAACACLFPESGAASHLRVETRVARLGGSIRPNELRALGVPVSLAFLIPSAVHSVVYALYPNARGATEGTFSSEVWAALARSAPELERVTPDIEGVFLSVSGEDETVDATLVSLDVIHAIVGELRSGAAPGTALWTRIRRHIEDAARGGHD